MLKGLTLLLVILFISSNIYSQKLMKRNPNAPEELEQFNFLLGTFDIEGKSKTRSGEYSNWTATWTGYYTLDGYVFADDFEMVNGEGNYVFLGTTYRIYNQTQKKWLMKFVDGLQQIWMDIEGEYKNGEMRFKGVTPNGISDITFRNITEDGFEWKSDLSRDGGKTWIENSIVIKATRRK